MDVRAGAVQDARVSEQPFSLWRRAWRALEDLLPGPPDRRHRDESGRDRSEERQRRLKMQMLEKRGKGGTR